MPREVVKIHLTLSSELLEQVNKLARHDFETRSGFIRAAIKKYIYEDARRAAIINIKNTPQQVTSSSMVKEPKSAIGMMTAQQKEAYIRYKTRQITFRDFYSTGITQSVILALIREGEL